MKRIALTTALALSLAAPAFANEQLAASLGVDAGDYTVAELIQLRTALENDDHTYVSFLLNGGSETVSTQSFGAPGHVATALRILEDDDEQISVYARRNGGDEQVSTQSFGEPEHVAIARALVGFVDNENE